MEVWRGKFKDKTGQCVPFLGWDRTMGARFMSAPDNGACFSTGWKSVCVLGGGSELTSKTTRVILPLV